MAGQDKRVIEQQATSEVFADDWFLKDSVTEGTTKISSENLKAWINDGMATKGDIETVVKNIDDTYSELESYAEGDLCIHEYALFKCTGTTTGTWDSTKWQATTVAELLDSIDLSAEAISYDNTASGLEAENVQDAIDEVLETAGKVKDVQDEGNVSVVDENKIAHIDHKANKVGTYDDLVVGTAQNLLSESFTEDKVPYNFRQSFNGARLEDEIVGGTVVWNQSYKYTVDGENLGVRVLVQNGVVTLSGTSTGTGSGRPFAWTDYKFTPSHKIIILKDFNVPSGDYIFDQYNLSSSADVTGRIVNVGSGGYIIPQIKINAIGNVYNVSNGHLSVIDLTQALGSTIADYLYTIDQANEGAGLAKLQEWGFCTKSYYAYNAGTLMSVNASSHDTTGKNQFDIDSPHEAVSGSATYTYTVRVKPNTAYTMSSNVPQDNPASLYFNGGATNVNGVWNGTPRTFTSDANGNFVVYVRYSTVQGGIDLYTAVKNGTYWIQLEEGSTATAYKPYTKHTYPLDSDLTLRGIPKLDANNNLYYDGDIYKSDGSVTRRFGVVDLGSLTWSHASSNRSISNAIANTIKKPATQTSLANLLTSNIYTQVPSNTSLSINGQFAVSQSGEMIFYYDGVNEPKGYMVYELATPTSETADAFINPQIVDARGTEEYVDYAESQGTRDVAIPVGHNSKYYADLKSIIENIPDVPSAYGTYTLKATRSASGVTFNWVNG